MLILIGMFVTLLVVIVSAPYPYPHARDPVGGDGDPVAYYQRMQRSSAAECVPEMEVWDPATRLCAPATPTPLPIVGAMRDTGVSACESMYRRECGRWMSNHTNENRSFGYLVARNQATVHQIVTDPTSGPVYTFYRSCLDTLVHGKHQRISQKHREHVLRHVMESFHQLADLPIVLAKLASFGFAAPFAVTIEGHPLQPLMVPTIQYGGAELEQYLQVGGNERMVLERYLAHYHPLRAAKRLADAQEMIRKLRQWSRLDPTITDLNSFEDFMRYLSGDQFTGHDMTTMGTLVDMAPADSRWWTLYLRQLGGYTWDEELEEDSTLPVWLFGRRYVAQFFRNLQSITLEQWKAYVELSIMSHTHTLLPTFSVGAESHWRPGSSISFLDAPASRKEIEEYQCVSLVHHLMPHAVDRLFLHREYGGDEEVERTRHRITAVVERVRDTYAHMLGSCPWMSPSLRERAVTKVRNILVRVIHPNQWGPPEPFAQRLTLDRYLHNVMLALQHRIQRNLDIWLAKRPHSPLDRDRAQRFGAPLSTVNAYYSPSSNTITVFAGLVQAPFYHPQFSELALYATLGVVVGHELGHAMDSTGRYYDEQGSMRARDWWTPRDEERFHEKTQCIQREYGAPLECKSGAAYGEQTLGEDMADIIGVEAAFLAANVTHQRDAQLFFQIFAQLWCEAFESREAMCTTIDEMHDPHAISWYRVDHTLRNSHHFRDAFGCPPGSDMVHAPPCTVY